MTTSLLFMDECLSGTLDIAALTGVLVPIAQYADVRDAMCRIALDCMPRESGVVPRVIELHGSALLKDSDGRPPEEMDAIRLGVFAEVVNLLNTHRLPVCRVAYTNRKEVAAALIGDPNLYGVNFFGLQQWLAPHLAGGIVIPVMDGIPDSSSSSRPPRINSQLIRAFAQNTRYLHHMRAAGIADSNISVAYPGNLAEPVFGDSSHSVLLQLVDIISYLLHQIEKDALGAGSRSDSSFGATILKCAREIDPTLLTSWRGELKMRTATGT